MQVVVATQNADLAVDVRPRAEAAALAAAGYDCTLVGGTHDPEQFDHDADGVAVELFRQPRPAQGAAGQMRELAQAFVRIADTLVAVARERPIDVLHTGNPPDNLWLLLGRIARAQGYQPRFVYDQHDVAPVLAKEKFGHAPHAKALIRATRRFERASFARADLVVFANDEYARRAQAERLLRSPFVVVPNGWRLPAASVNGWKRPGEQLVAYIGTINEQDSVTHLVEALALLPDIVRTRVVVAGDGSDRARAEQRAIQLGISSSIDWLGWVTNRATLGSLVTSADVCVAPESDSSFNRLASFVKIVEYMSLGAATVAHRLPQTEQLCGDSIQYAEEMTPAALATAIQTLLHDPNRRQQLGSLAQKRFDRSISWANAGAPRLAEAYRQVFGAPT
jgi:glycosyltransferase involved in cell wall biosynthesis